MTFKETGRLTSDKKGNWSQSLGIVRAVHYDEDYAQLRDHQVIPPRTTKFFTAWLASDAYNNRPSHYRFLQRVQIGEAKDTLLMAEFRLSDKGSEWQGTAKTPVPKVVTAVDSAAVLPHWGLDTTPDRPAMFSGGEEALKKFLTLKAKDYPNVTPGEIVLTGIVTWDGRMIEVRSKGATDNLYRHVYAERFVREMPPWQPAMYRGDPIYSRVELTVVFK